MMGNTSGTSLELVSHPMANQPDRLWNKHWKKSRTVVEIDPPVSLDAPIKVDAVRFVCVSDTHTRFGEMVEENLIPAGDVLLHCGDITHAGRKEHFIEFNEQLGKLPHPIKIVIAGNHDLGCEDGEDVNKRPGFLAKEGTEPGYKMLTNCVYLQDSSTEVYGIKVYGTSWHPLAGWSFYRKNGPEIMAEWRKIPADVDVLMTHTPPLGHMDTCVFGGRHVGSPDLLDVVEKHVKPKFHVFGHIHECHGVTTNNVTTFINASSCNFPDQEKGLLWDPICFDIPLPTGHTKNVVENPQRLNVRRPADADWIVFADE